MQTRRSILRSAVGCRSVGGSLATALAAGPDVARTSIEIRAGIDEALRCWSEFSAADGAWPQGIFASRRADFEPLAGSHARITLRLVQWGPIRDPAATRRALEDRLRTFKSFVEERASCTDSPCALR